MAAPAIEQVKISTDGSNDTSQVASNFDSAPTTNNTLIWLSAVDGNPGVSVGPTGWTQFIYEAKPTGNDPTIFGWWKKSAGDENGGTESWTSVSSERSVSIMFELSGAVDPSVTAPTTAASPSEGDSTTITPPAVSSLSSDDYLSIVWAALDTGDESASAGPSGYSQPDASTWSTGVSGSGGVTLVYGYKAFTGTGETPGSFTNTTEAWVSQTVVIQSSGASSNSTAPLGGVAGDGGLAGSGGIAGPGGGIIG